MLRLGRMWEVALLLRCVHTRRMRSWRRLRKALVGRELRRASWRTILGRSIWNIWLYGLGLGLVLLARRPLHRRLRMSTSVALLRARLEWLLARRERRETGVRRAVVCCVCIGRRLLEVRWMWLIWLRTRRGSDGL